MTHWQGKLELTYAKQEGATQMIHALNHAPLKVQRPFYPEGEQICHTVGLHTAGGIVGGDILMQNLHLHPRSEVFFTTPAASKIYRSNGQQAQQQIEITLEENAILEWFPQESIIFNGADYCHKMRVNLAPNAVFLGWEITRFGRTARGEQFMSGEWRSHNEFWQQDTPVWIDRQWLPGHPETVQSLHGLANSPIVASFIALGLPNSTSLLENARQLWPTPPQRGEFGLTTTQNQGLLCRYRGHSLTEIKQRFVTLWHFLRQNSLSRPKLHPRVWM
ncbi:urease accessory protein UreD [Spirulina sp. CS-785/01]|uniref:urease accessory protein UreD n=1 Tax=Spirulina sp. CS-785/01 TaxID=3021716 RepID=UPI00232C9447|nr:urease accessory protein UreD [Spirulina sp. CS-785/01]MDB9313872.1 urease accessory protein UreD [Spirulina sp. CS-785/01]